MDCMVVNDRRKKAHRLFLLSIAPGLFVTSAIGGSYLSSFYDIRTEALEKVFQLGVLPVIAAGNEGNIPYIAGKQHCFLKLAWTRIDNLTYLTLSIHQDRERKHPMPWQLHLQYNGIPSQIVELLRTVLADPVSAAYLLS